MELLVDGGHVFSVPPPPQWQTQSCADRIAGSGKPEGKGFSALAGRAPHCGEEAFLVPLKAFKM